MPHRPEDDWTRPMPRTRRGQPVDDWDDDWQVDDRRAPRQDDWQVDDRRAPRQDDWHVDDRRTPRQDDWHVEDRRVESDRRAPATRTTPPRTTPPRTTTTRGAPPPAPPASRPPRRRRPRYGFRRFLLGLIVLLLLYVGAIIWALSAAWSAIDRVDATPDNLARPGDAAGSNVLLVGTDSRADLTDEQRRELKTGSTEGARADTIMLLHLPGGGGEPTLLSLPRDSYVEIPGSGFNKINAAYANGGAPLLVDTVEQSTGLPVDGYVEIGFDGFVDVVGTVDGVRMCLPEPVFEERSDLDLPAGCQDLVGKDALSYVRMRYADPRGDLGRVERQRQFLASLVQRLSRPSTILVPWRLRDAGVATGSSLAIGEDTSMWEMARVALAMKDISNDQGISVTVPVADADYRTGAGSTVLWDEVAAQEMFEALRTDEPLSIDP